MIPSTQPNSDSARAKLSQEVLQTLVAENADIIAIQETKLSAKGPTKKHLEILEELFPGYENTWRSSQEPARKGYAGTMFLYKKELTPTVTFPEIGAPSTMDLEGRIITLEFDEFFVTQVYTQTLATASNVWKNAKSGMSNMRSTWLN